MQLIPIYFLKNIPILLGLDQNKWLELKTEPKKFENYILELEKQMNDEHLIELNGRYLSIYSYQWEDEFLVSLWTVLKIFIKILFFKIDLNK